MAGRPTPGFPPDRMRDMVDDLLAVSAAAFDPLYGEAWNRAQLEGALLTPNTHCLRAKATGEVVLPAAPLGPDECAGFLLSRAAPGEEELLLIAVDPACRRTGIGTALLQRFFHDARSRGTENIFLEMRENNPAAQFYERSGFRPVGRRRGYYRMSTGGTLDAITYCHRFPDC